MMDCRCRGQHHYWCCWLVRMMDCMYIMVGRSMHRCMVDFMMDRFVVK